MNKKIIDQSKRLKFLWGHNDNPALEFSVTSQASSGTEKNRNKVSLYDIVDYQSLIV